ncbi:hypothetical protein ACWGOQ_0017540 [Aquimarina sp. M1]
MKKGSRKKLSLDKIKIAKIDHLDRFRGGSQDTTEYQTNEYVCFTKSLVCETTWDCGVSTKTIPVGASAVCL